MPTLAAINGALRGAAKVAATSASTARRTRASERIYPVVGLCRSAGLPEPVPEWKFHPVRKWRFDYAWVLHKLAMEIDGGLWVNGRHSRGSGRIKEMEKHSEAAIWGWRILFVTPAQVRDGTALGLLLRALNRTEVAA